MKKRFWKRKEKKAERMEISDPFRHKKGMVSIVDMKENVVLGPGLMLTPL